jgi:hypothetical protein
MRFIHHDHHTPDVGDTRKVRRFLWLPVRIGNETRWLEMATIREVAYMGTCCAPDGPTFQCLKWRENEFLG